jgi:GTP-binding protein LepA
MFKIAIQAGVVQYRRSRETISAAYRKDVTAKCYGGDISGRRNFPRKAEEGRNA